MSESLGNNVSGRGDNRALKFLGKKKLMCLSRRKKISMSETQQREPHELRSERWAKGKSKNQEANFAAVIEAQEKIVDGSCNNC